MRSHQMVDKSSSLPSLPPSLCVVLIMLSVSIYSVPADAQKGQQRVKTGGVKVGNATPSAGSDCQQIAEMQLNPCVKDLDFVTNDKKNMLFECYVMISDL